MFCHSSSIHDLSAAFDTVDHELLLQRLSNRFRIKGNVLQWFKCYLYERKQFVCVEGALSSNRDIHCGVPQRSVLGPILYLLYTSPLIDIIQRHGLSYHLYADDLQLYLSLKATLNDQETAVTRTEACINEIHAWMIYNKLKLNKDKTELLIIGAQHGTGPTTECIRVVDECIYPSNSAKNIGLIFDQHINLEQHMQISGTCKSAYFHMRNIACHEATLKRWSMPSLLPN